MSWYNTDWKFRKKISIKQSYINNSINNFTLSIKLRKEYDLLNYSKSDLSDLIVVDSSGNQLPSYIDYADKEGNFNIKCKIDLNNSSNELYLYYGNNTFTYEQDSQNTYGLYDFVSKMDMLYPETSPSLLKTNSGDYHLTRKGYNYNKTNELGFNPNNPIEYGTHLYDSNDQFYQTQPIAVSGSTNLSMSLWLNRDEYENTDDDIFGQIKDFYIGLGANRKLYTRVTTNESSKSKYSNVELSKNRWYYIVVDWNANTELLRIFIDGILDSSHIIRGSYIKNNNANKINIGNWYYNTIYSFKGSLSDIRVSTNPDITDSYIFAQYNNDRNLDFISISNQEINPSLISEETGWRLEHSDYNKRIKFDIKGSEIIGNDEFRRFPFLLNLYDQCLNEAAQYGNDVLITDEYGERLPFERFLYRQHINQTRYAGAYKIILNGNAKLIYDTNAEGGYRCGYLDGTNDYIKFSEIRIVELGTHDLKIRYSNGGSTSATNIYINDDLYTINLPPTGSWSSYQEIEVPVNWTQEWNEISFGKNSSSCDIDWLEPQDQNMTQLKGFVLLPKLKHDESTSLYIYYGNAVAPIRFNPAYGQPIKRINAENLSYTNASVVNNSKFKSGKCVKANAYMTAEAITSWDGVSGFYDITTEILASNSDRLLYDIYINNIKMSHFDTHLVSANMKMYNTTNKIYLAVGDELKIKTTGKISELRFDFSIFDTNPNWNSEEVWSDYEAVWHMSGTPDDGAPMLDYSGNNRHINTYNMDAGTNSVNNSIGAGVLFYDKEDALYGQFEKMDLNQDDLTISLWSQNYESIDGTKGLFVSDSINLKIENKVKLSFTMSDDVKSDAITEIDNVERFSYIGLTRDYNTEVRGISVNGDTKKETQKAFPWSGNNDSITFGKYYNEDNLIESNWNSFKGVIAEVRIKKAVLTENWQANEYKNIKDAQQYIDYNSLECASLARHYVVSDNGGEINTDINSNSTIIFERENNANIDTKIESDSIIIFEREMDGSIGLTSGNLEREFIILTEESVKFLYSNKTPYIIPHTIEFVRFFTGGITSGRTLGTQENIYIPDITGSLSFGNAVVSHEIADGYTVDVYFNDAVGGKTLSSGTITELNISNYINIISGGVVNSTGSDIYLRESHYVDNKALVIVNIFDSSVDIEHSVLYNDPTDNSPIIINIESDRVNKYNDSDYIQYIKALGTPSLHNEFITDVEVSGIFFSNGSAIKKIIYTIISDNAIAITNNRFQKLDVEEEVLYNDSDYIQYINILGENKSDRNIYLNNDILVKVDTEGESVVEEVNAILDPSGKINITEAVLFDYTEFKYIAEYGNINIVSTITTITYSKDNYTEITNTDAFKGGVATSSIVELDIININIDTEVVIVSYGSSSVDDFVNYKINDIIGGTAIVQADANLHQGVLYDPLRALYFYSCDYAKLTTKISNERIIDFRNIPSGEEFLTSGVAVSNIEIVERSYGSVETNILSEKAIVYNSIPTETLVKTIVISQYTETNYKNETNGIIKLSSQSERVSDFVFIPNDYIIPLKISSMSNLNIFFDNSVKVKTKGISVRRESISKYYPDVYGGADFKGTATLVYDSTLIKVGSQLVGNVATLDDVPLDTAQGDIYYVIDNPISKYWEKRGENLVPIANPLNNNTGISGFANSKNELPSSGSYDNEVYLVGSPQDPEYYIWDASYGENGLWILTPEYQPNNTGVQGVLNSVDELPTTGNTGDTWLIGSSNDGVYYLWDENSESWIIDEETQPQMKIELESISVLKTSGVIVLNEVIYTTDEEVSGYIRWVDLFETKLDLNSAISVNNIQSSGNYEQLIINNVSTQKVNIISLSNEDTIPVINRANSNHVEVFTKIYNTNKIEFICASDVDKIKTSGSCKYGLEYTPRVIKASVILSNHNDIISKDSVFAFLSEVNINLGIKFDIDDVTFNSSNETAKLIIDSQDLFNVLDINESNEFAKVKIIEQLITTPLPIFYTRCSGVVNISYNETLRVVNVTTASTQMVSISDEVIAQNSYNVVSITGKSIKWRKDVVAGLIYIGDTLEAIYIPNGTIKISQRYFEIKVEYNYNSLILINTSGETKASRYYIGNIISKTKNLSGTAYRDAVYNNNNANGFVKLYPLSITESNYETLESILEVSTLINTEYNPVYLSNNIISLTTSSKKVAAEMMYDNITVVNSIDISIESDRKVYRNSLIEDKNINLSNIIEESIIYNPVLSYPNFIISNGKSYKAEVIVDKRVVAEKIIIDGVASLFVDYNRKPDMVLTKVNIVNVERITYSPDCGFAKLRTRIGILKDIEHGFYIYRDFVGTVLLNGVLDPSLCYQSYNTICDGGINALGGETYEEENIYRFNDFSYNENISITSDKTTNIYSKNYIYDIVDNVVKLSGNFTDPIEFFITQFGIANVFGSAKTALRYDNDMTVGTLSIKIGGEESEYFEQNKYRYFSNGNAEVFNNDIEVDFIPTFEYEVFGGLSTDGSLENELVYNYLYSMYGKCFITGTYDMLGVKNFIAESSGGINIYLEDRIYNLNYTPVVICTVEVDGNVDYEDISVNYSSRDGGIAWGKGTAADITDSNDFVNISSSGFINISPIADVEMTSEYSYVGRSSHLGSIKIAGEADKNPEIFIDIEVASVRTRISSSNALSTTYKRCYGKVKVNISSENIQAGFIYKTDIVSINISGKSESISEYNYDISLSPVVISGAAISKVDTEYIASGLILLNGINGGNLTIKPLVSGWLILSGEICRCSNIDYGELDSEIIKIQLISNTLYRTNLGDDLEFNEITHRREYEAGLTDSEVDTPDEVWSSKQNFNDLIEE